MTTSKRPTEPPGWAEWVLERLLPAEDRRVVCDDVAERYRLEIVPVHGRFRAWIWYLGEVVRSVLPALQLRLRRRRLGGWRTDFRIALRGLIRRPGWAAAAVGTLALGIAGTMSIYGAVRSVLLRPLPYGDASRIVAFSSAGDWSGPEYLEVEAWGGPFESIAAVAGVEWTWQKDGEASLVEGYQGTAALFDVLAVAAVRGRVFEPGDDRPGAEPVVVISHGFWAGELGGDPSVVGRPITLDGVTRTIVGVMPPEFHFPTPAVRFWAALPMGPDLWQYGLLGLTGRLPAGLDPAAAASALAPLGERLRERFTYNEAWDKTRTLSLTPIRSALVGETGRPLALLFGAVALLLLVSCANVSALVLGRSVERRGELALRAALGAGRGRLSRQAFTESLALALPGGLLGAAGGALGFRVLRGTLPVADAWRETLTTDWSFVAAAIAVTLVAGSLVGLVSVHGVLRGDLEPTLRRAGRRSRGGGGGALSALVIAEVALTVILVTGAGALVRSVSNMQTRDTGIDASGLFVVDLVAGSGDFDEAGRRMAFERIIENVGSRPGIEQVALTQRLPFRDGGWNGPVTAEARPDLEDNPPSAFWRHVTAAYFETLGMRLVAGRGFRETDDARASGVAVVNRSLARLLWPDRQPMGERVRTGITPEGVWLSVVGVVDDVPVTGLRDEPQPVLYVPWSQAGVVMEGNSLLVRSGLLREAAVGTIRAAIRQAENRVAVARVTTMPAVISQSIAEPRQLMLLLNVFGGLALFLGAVGIYGMLANWVRGRTYEFGVRLALGSSPRSVIGLVAGKAARLVGTGLLIGAALSMFSSRLYGAFLYDVGVNSVRTLGLAMAILTTTAAVATWLPSRRAARSDPMAALRAE